MSEPIGQLIREAGIDLAADTLVGTESRPVYGDDGTLKYVVHTLTLHAKPADRTEENTRG